MAENVHQKKRYFASQNLICCRFDLVTNQTIIITKIFKKLLFFEFVLEGGKAVDVK